MNKKPYFGMIYDTQIYLSVLKDGLITHQRRFLKFSPTLIEIWERVEPTPFTRLMLEILNRGNHLVQKKVTEYDSLYLFETKETS